MLLQLFWQDKQLMDSLKRQSNISFNADIEDDNFFKSFKYKTKLLRNTRADGANRILKNTTVSVTLKYLRNFLGSLEMLLINCKVKIKLK